MGSVATDITERKGSEAALREAEGRVRVVVDSALDGIVLMDVAGCIETANPAATTMFGYEPEELVGQTVNLLIPELHSSADGVTRQNNRAGIERMVGRPHEVVGQRKNRSTFPLDLAIADSINHHGGFVGTLHDLTDRKRLEEQLLHAQKMDSIGRLAGGVAHDYNNLLAIIIGFGDMVEADLPEDDVHLPMVKNILSAAWKAANLTQQLLAFARKQTYMPRMLSVNPLLQEVVQLLRPIIVNSIELVALFSEEEHQVFLDPGQLEQVLVNLAVNARDAMPAGGKLIFKAENVSLTEPVTTGQSLMRPGAYVLVSVTDTGQGMSKTVLEQLFEPFFTTKEPGKGTGLGLATVYGIIHQAEGHISVESEEGVGTTFKIYLPRHESESIGIAPIENGAGTQGDELVLVVDDEPLVRELMVGALKGHGYTVLTAENGQAALRVLAASPTSPDLLITDAIMPLMGGRELIERFREIHSDIPIIIASGYSAEGWGSQPQMLAKGMTFMQKPFTARALLEHVRQALDLIV